MNTNNFDKYSNKGLSGLTNLGNTCFLNSCMQVLSHTYELNDFLNLETYKKRLKNKYDSALLLEWDELRKMLWNENCVVTPSKFVKTVQRLAHLKKMDDFTGHGQNDLPEFLVFIIDCFHNSLSREVNMTINGEVENDKDKLALLCFTQIKQMYSNDYSEIWNIFYGVHVSQLSSVATGEVMSLRPEPYFIINLPIPQDNSMPSLIDCFDLYVEGEVLDGDNCVLNETTKKREAAKKQLFFWSFPSVLVIDIKRFNSKSRKNQILVDFPLENLNLSKYIIGYNRETYIYDLYGVCNHSGSSLGGHYTAFVKNANGNWYHYNDNSVSLVTDLNHIVTSKAYCFFYRKRK